MNQPKPLIAIACDHAGFAYKEEIKKQLQEDGYGVKDFGTHTTDSVDYPDFVHPLSKAVSAKECDFGVLICGSANGVAITANKYAAIRASICWENELASLARQHNDANVICLPARFVSLNAAKEMVNTFLTTDFEGGRHQTRVDKITNTMC